ncbi:MAG: xanthine dehydrogenase family protein subunit M [Anaerolineales bacterium]|nr:xanthine dehydrogenase family protein subunit M [Anaerolineales bacterium]
MYPFEYIEPSTLPEAVAALAEHGPDAVALAGGTDLLVMMRADTIRPKVVVNIKRIPGLSGIAATNGDVRVGALTLVRDIEKSPVLRARAPALSEAARWLGSVQIRHLATIGGNLCRAAPSAEMAPTLLALGARLHLVGVQGQRVVPVEDFFLGPGRTVLQPGEILVEISLDGLAPRSGSTYLRHSIRPLMDLALVNVAAYLALDAAGTITEARIALGAVAPTPIRARAAEAELCGHTADPALFERATEAAVAAARPISDVRSTAVYRSRMVRLLTQRALAQTLAAAQNGHVQ